MAAQLIVPDLGSDATGGILAEWYLADGASVERGDLAGRYEVATIAIDLETDTAGTLSWRVAPGAAIGPGAVAAVVVSDGERDEPYGEPDGMENSEAASQDRRPWLADPESKAEPADGQILHFRVPAGQDEGPGEPITWHAAMTDDDEEPADLSWPADESWLSEPALAESAAAADRETEIAMPATAAAFVRTTIDLREFRRLRADFTQEWNAQGIAPSDADLVVQAITWAAGSGGALAIVTPAEDGERVIPLPARGRLRFDEMVRLRMEPAAESIVSCDGIYDFGATGIDEAVPPLARGTVLAFGLGAAHDAAIVRAGGIFVAPLMTLTLAYAPDLITPGGAATIVSRVRDLAESPFALLAD